RRRPPQRYAVMAEQTHAGPDLEDRRLRPLDVRPAEQRRSLEPFRCDERNGPGHAHPAPAAALVGQRPAMIARLRTGAASLPLLRSGLIGWAAVIGTGLAALAMASFAADRSMANAAVHPGLSITVTGNQWWWDVQYSASDTSKSIRTANELHLPVGIPAHITL